MHANAVRILCFIIMSTPYDGGKCFAHHTERIGGANSEDKRAIGWKLKSTEHAPHGLNISFLSPVWTCGENPPHQRGFPSTDVTVTS
jgi:hypothetical protein